MDGKARHGAIRDLLVRAGRLGVGDLATRLGVTAMTIRRDLAAMEQGGLLTRTHGGCVLQAPFVPDRSFAEKIGAQEAEKRAIAAEAARRVGPGESVYLDTGTTALHVARALPSDRSLRVFTNNLRIALELAGRTGIEVMVYGGRLAERSPDLVGETAVSAAGWFPVDVAVLGCDAVDVARGELYAADLGTAALSRQVQRLASRVMFLADHTKLGRRGSAVVGRLGKGMTLITDAGVPAGLRARLRRTKACVVVAKPAR